MLIRRLTSNSFGKSMQRTSHNILLSVKNVAKRFELSNGSKHVEVLQGIDLEIYEGEFLVILGPNGCGKTTLLKIIAGLIPCDEGSVNFTNKNDGGPRYGIVFQKPLLLPWLTVEQNIYLPLRVSSEYPKEGLSDYIDPLVLLTEMRPLLKKYPKELSGGERQKAAILRALITKPRMLIMDEPFSALDAETRHKLQEYLVGLWKATEKTFLFVTHSLEEACCIANRIVVLSRKPCKIQEIMDVPWDLPRFNLLSNDDSDFDAFLSNIRRLMHAI
jgi:NitT/TauT family transport system ATP-binding protein